jgi:hypothetical protein
MNEPDAEIIRSSRGGDAKGADMAAARASGETAGADLLRPAGDNPFGHTVMDLRTAWFDGFSAGRARAARERGEDY